MSHCNDNAIDLAIKLCARQSITPHDGGCLELIDQCLQPLGFNCQRLDYDEVSNLYATIGSGAPHLLLLGHVDVVPTGDAQSWHSPPFTPTIRNNHLYARGIADMKGAVACFVTAAQQFVQEQSNFNGTLSIILTSDEEGPAINGIQRVVSDYFLTNDINFDYCLVCEPTSDLHPGDKIKIGRRGSLGATLTVQGKQGHVAYPHNAINPIHLAAPLISELTQMSWNAGNQYFPATTLQISNISAGTGATNVIPDTLRVLFNIRYGNAYQSRDLQHRINQCLQQYQLDYRIDYHDSALPYLSGDDGVLVKACQRAAKRVFGQDAKLSTEGGTSDGRFIAPMGVETIEFGPLNGSIHQINENLSLEQLRQFPRAYKQIISDLLI